MFDSYEFDTIDAHDNKRTRRTPVVADLRLSNGRNPRRLLADEIWGKDYRKEFSRINFGEDKEHSVLPRTDLHSKKGTISTRAIVCEYHGDEIVKPYATTTSTSKPFHLTPFEIESLR
jgi:hypothetical protein